MNIINPTWKAVSLSADPRRSRARERKKAKRKEEWAEYSSTQHTYELMHNRQRMGIFKKMKGSKAKEINAQFVQEYTAAVDAAYPLDVAEPMQRWTLCPEAGMAIPPLTKTT